MKSKLRFYLITETKFKGTCDVRVVNPSDLQKIKCKSTSGLISNLTLLHETALESLQKYLIDNKIVMYFKIEIMHKFFTRNIHMNVTPNTTLCEEGNSERPILNLKIKRQITFKIEKELNYSLPIETLYAINSKYFKNICDYAMFENEEDIYEVEIDEMPVPFKQMLSFILSGSIPDPFNYHMLRDLLIMVHKYDVQTLKILCESYLIRMINIENSINLIQLAFSCEADSLKKGTILFIKLYLKEILRIKEFECLQQQALQNNLDEILELVYNVDLPLDITQ